MKWLIGIISVLVSLSGAAQGPNQDLFDEINTLRKQRRLPELEYDSQYQSTCDTWAKRLSKSFGHSFYNRKDIGEAICINFPSQDIVKDFMDSKPHKKTLMNRVARKICIGVYQVGPNDPIYVCIRTYR
jgi:uncharacterized protein YkwD